MCVWLHNGPIHSTAAMAFIARYKYIAHLFKQVYEQYFVPIGWNFVVKSRQKYV